MVVSMSEYHESHWLEAESCVVWDAKPESKDEPVNWVELKTSAEIENDRDMLKYERKLLKFWIQSFLLGVPKIIVGFRSKHGILQRLEELETRNIPNIVMKKGKATWDGNTCINFTASFLECKVLALYPVLEDLAERVLLGLKSNISSEGVWKIKRKERSSVIELFKVEECGHCDILSEEFVSWRNRDMKGTSSPEPPI